jgi:hypothetical protein
MVGQASIDMVRDRLIDRSVSHGNRHLYTDRSVRYDNKQTLIYREE